MFASNRHTFLNLNRKVKYKYIEQKIFLRAVIAFTDLIQFKKIFNCSIPNYPNYPTTNISFVNVIVAAVAAIISELLLLLQVSKCLISSNVRHIEHGEKASEEKRGKWIKSVERSKTKKKHKASDILVQDTKCIYRTTRRQIF